MLSCKFLYKKNKGNRKKYVQNMQKALQMLKKWYRVS